VALDTQGPFSVASTSHFSYGLVEYYVSVCVMVVLGNVVT